MTTLAMLVMGLVTASMVPAEDKKPAKDEDQIQGTWQVVSGNRGGEDAPDEFKKSFRLTFKAGGKLTILVKGEAKNGTFKFDAAKKPRQIEITADDKTLEGIYELDGDTLKLCVSEGGARPTEFKSPVGSRSMLMILKREKK